MRTVIVSKRAAVRLASLLDYLETEWSEKVKHNFIQKLDRVLKIIASHPHSFEKSELKPDLFRCVVNQYTTLYYQFNEREIKIVSLFDTRMNPGRLKKEISGER